MPGKLSDEMAERLLFITKKFALNYGESYEELYAFVATLTPQQQDDITLTLIRGNRGCSTCSLDTENPFLDKARVFCNLLGVVDRRKCCDDHRRKP